MAGTPKLDAAKSWLAMRVPSQRAQVAAPARSTCRHEAGHAVFAMAVGIGITGASVIPDSDYIGRVYLVDNWQSPAGYVDVLGMWASGYVAEQGFQPAGDFAVLDGFDAQQFDDALNRRFGYACTSDKIRARRAGMERARKVLTDNWWRVTSVANALMRHHKLDGAQLQTYYWS